MMKKQIYTLFAALAFVSAAFSNPGLAQQAPPAVIVVVDFNRVTNESAVGRDVSAQMETNRIDLEARALDLNDQLNREQEELNRQRSVIAPEAFEERVRAFTQKQQVARQEIQEKTQQRQVALQQAQLEIQRVLRPIVKDVMEKHGATLVLDKNIVQHHIAGLDVTTEVVEQLDANLPSFKVTLPGQQPQN